MSAGAFLRSRYSTDGGEVAAIRVQPETLALEIDGGTNAAPSGAITIPGSASVGRGKRSNGINARLVRIVFSGTPPTGYKPDSPIALPWVNGVGSFGAINVGDTGTYLGAPIIVIGKTPEYVR